MKKLIKFGEDVEGYNIPVLNEREIRAAAGMLLILGRLIVRNQTPEYVGAAQKKGCKFYPLFFNDKVQYCPGEVCDTKQKQDIQKTSKSQLFILLTFIAFIFFTVYFMNDRFSEKPHALFGKSNTEKTK